MMSGRNVVNCRVWHESLAKNWNWKQMWLKERTPERNIIRTSVRSSSSRSDFGFSWVCAELIMMNRNPNKTTERTEAICKCMQSTGEYVETRDE